MPVPIEIIILGSGSSIPSLRRAHPAVLLRRAGDYFLFDCGEDCQRGLERAGISPMKIDKIFISHWHADHFAGLLPLLETLHLSGRTVPLEVYGPEASRFVSALIGLSYWGVGFAIRAIDCVGTQRLFETADYELWSVKTRHSIPSVGYALLEKPHWRIDVRLARKFGIVPGPLMSRIKELGKIEIGKKIIKLTDIARQIPGRKVVYSGDTLACRPLFALAAGADLLIHDGTFAEPAPTAAHPSAQQVARLAKRYKIKKLVLSHLSRRYKTSAEILRVVKPIFKNTLLARDGLRITLR